MTAQAATSEKGDTPQGVFPASAVPEVLSPSSVNCFAHDCQVKWFYRKVMQYPEVRGAALGLLALRSMRV